MYTLFLAHLAEGHENLCHGTVSGVCPASIRCQLFPLNDFFSKTTGPIFQPNLVGIMLGGWGFRFVQIKGLASFGVQKGAK